MKKLPDDWPRITPAIFYDEAGAAIEWLCETFGFELRLRIDGEGGRVEHSELEFGEGLIMVATSNAAIDPGGSSSARSPRSLAGANTQKLCVYVDDVDAHHEHAKERGAEILVEPKTDDYGEEWGSNRSYRVLDPEGHCWTFLTRVRDPKPHAG